MVKLWAAVVIATVACAGLCAAKSTVPMQIHLSLTENSTEVRNAALSLFWPHTRCHDVLWIRYPHPSVDYQFVY